MDFDAMSKGEWIELLLVGGVAFGFGLWQLWSVNRDIAKDKEQAVKTETDQE